MNKTYSVTYSVFNKIDGEIYEDSKTKEFKSESEFQAVGKCLLDRMRYYAGIEVHVEVHAVSWNDAEFPF